MHWPVRRTLAVVAAGGLCLAGTATAAATSATPHVAIGVAATPIQHVVVIFDENVSFDHYFGTYPSAANTDGTTFHALRHTPSVNGLTPALLNHNPNLNNPARLSNSEALTCDQGHAYTAEQKALDNGLMDQFVQNTENTNCSPPEFSTPGLVMDYYDGNTVTALWNYAQRFAMSDNMFDTEFGPSTPGALNLISGQTWGGTAVNATGGVVPDPGAIGSPNTAGEGTVYGDPDPYYDNCSNHANPTVKMAGSNIGDLLNAANVTWGWFQGGFQPSKRTGAGVPICGRAHNNIGGVTVTDYNPHHNPFEYYASTANPNHTPPANVGEVGHNGQANHEYDLSWFFKDLNAGLMPSVSFLKAANYQDGHAGYSDPLDEQHFLVHTINSIEKSKFWKSTAIIVTYDDSDGWYDSVMPPIVNSSADPALDALNGTGVCGHGTAIGGLQDRCGYGQRLPFLVISPFTKQNYVSSSLIDTSSVPAFIEGNWLGGQRTGPNSFDNIAGSFGDVFSFNHPNDQPLILDPTTGAIIHGAP
jgi:phospholipase C